MSRKIIMSKGFDANRDLTNFAPCLKAASYDFVGRYYNINNPSKNLTLGEAHVLKTAGLSIVAIWENGFPTDDSYFSYAKGVFDGTAAYHYASHTIGQPGETPIYFGVDYDVSPSRVNSLIKPYFQGISAAFHTISSANPIYKIGVYGSGRVCKALLTDGLVAFTWLAQSTGWAGYATFQDYNIKQAAEKRECQTTNGGVKGDPNDSPSSNEGSFTI